MNEQQILLSYYGDDFTGSADVLEALSLNGIPTILFIEPPKSNDIANFTWKIKPNEKSKWLAFGVAGIARSLDPEAMEAELDPIFHKLSRIPSRFFHYKICSTLDSSPKTGNIGKAMEIAEKYFPSSFIPMLMGLPLLNRFVVFGHLFAKIGTKTYRLDRHPVMSKHPVTPMDESDIRLHLHKQMDKNMALVDYFDLENVLEFTPQRLSGDFTYRENPPLILFDTLEHNHLKLIGEWLNAYGRKQHQLLLGSSAIEYALGEVFGRKAEEVKDHGPTSSMLIVSGSCSQTTADQITYVQNLGYVGIRLKIEQLHDRVSLETEKKRVIQLAVNHLMDGKHVVIYSALGPNDPSVRNTMEAGNNSLEPHFIAKTQAKITLAILNQTEIKRLVTAGGDTSGYILKELEIQALEFIQVLAPGAPMCVAHSRSKAIDGLEIAIKGGQNGTVQYFEWAQKGEVRE
ncbi:four-carbon acid sugar kinase family protein [Pararhodonellum marinum]|uniref:four-carbon acid sugar kinase family protein n=1 Tax=Pararhodonellum marinum TaxID=2755358 RepID=UPI00188DCF87|nr:four-carbon acid sugar kinase family protein [Pararhodonellum marinum]